MFAAKARATATAPRPRAGVPGAVQVHGSARLPLPRVGRTHAMQPDELSFDEGDVIYVSDTVRLRDERRPRNAAQSDPSWWKATINDKAGLVPFNYRLAQQRRMRR